MTEISSRVAFVTGGGGSIEGEIETPKKVQEIFVAQNRVWRPAE
jgi:hypothetical protein